jgi:hypothetical protein
VVGESNQSPERSFLDFVDECINWFRQRATRAQWFYNGSRVALISLSACLPALIANDPLGKEVPIIVSVVIAVLAGLDAQFRPGEQWRHHRSTQLALLRLKRAYEWKKGTSEAKDQFFNEVERLLEAEANQYWMFRITEWQQRK